MKSIWTDALVFISTNVSFFLSYTNSAKLRFLKQNFIARIIRKFTLNLLM